MDLVEIASGRWNLRHPWEVARARFFLRILHDAGLVRPGLRTLDVGAGDAWLAGRIADASGLTITCWDSGYTRTKPPPHPALSYVTSPPRGKRFELALLLDVLEHVENDASFLGEIVGERLAPGAAVLLSLPAWPALVTEHDRLLQHRRRYAPAAARALAEGAGLRLERSGGLFHSLAIARIALSLVERLRPNHRPHAHLGEWAHGPRLTGLISAFLDADAAIALLASRLELQLPGLSWWALCRRTS